MKTNFFYASLLCVGLFTITSCSHRLVGTWDVSSFETSTQGAQGVKLNNIGTMTFSDNGSGDTNLKYEVFQVAREEQLPFKWIASDEFVTIDGDKEQSEFVKTWIIVENKKKFQRWRSTDGQNQIQTLELKKL